MSVAVPHWRTSRQWHPLLAVLVFGGVMLHSGEPSPPVQIAAPAPVSRILGRDVQGWIDHLQRFENEKERRIAMLCLMDFGPAAAGALAELQKLCKDETQPETQRFAVRTLGAIGAAARPALAELLAILADQAKPASFRAAACAAIAQIDPDSAAVRKALLNAMRDRAKEVRAEAIDAVVMLADSDPAVIPALTKALGTQDDAAAAATALRCIGAAGIDPLLKAVEKGAAFSRIAAAQALGNMGTGGAQAAPTLLKAIARERDTSARHALIIAAARVTPTDAAVLEALVDALSWEQLPPPAEQSAVNPVRQPHEIETQFLIDAGTAAQSALAKAVRSADAAVRLTGVTLMAKLNPPPDEVLDHLAARVQDKDDAVRLAAIKALDAFGPAAKKVETILIDAAKLEKPGEPAQRAAALAAVNVAREPGKPRHRSPWEVKKDEEVLAALKDPAPAIRVEAAEALRVRAADNGTLAQALLDALNDPDEKVKIAAAKSLVRYGKFSRVALTTFAQWLEVDNPGLKKAALTALAGMGADAQPTVPLIVKAAISELADSDEELGKILSIVLRMIGPDAVPALTAELKKTDAAVRRRAARAIASMEAVGATAIPDLIELSKSAVDSDAQAAFEALEAMGPVAYGLAAPHLVTVLLGDLFPERRKWAAWALGEIKVPADGDKARVIDQLTAALLDPDEAVCRAAHGSLARIGAPALPKLREMLKLGEGEAPYWAVRVLARMKADPADVIPRLVELTHPGKLPVERGTAAELLGEYAPAHPEIVPALIRVLGDREDYVAAAAVRSLAPFGQTAIEQIVPLLRQYNPLLRRRAVQAIDEIREAAEAKIQQTKAKK